MLKKELTTALAVMGVIAPFAVNADYSTDASTTSSGGGQPSYIAGESIKTGALPGGYNQTANYRIDDSYDVYFTADFIYWNLQQDNLKMGNLIEPTSSGAVGLLTGSDKALFSDTKYKPGFQVGLGFNMKGMDNWNLYGEYTWYQNKVSNTVTADSGQVIAFPFAQEGAVTGATGDVVVADSISGSSKYHFNNLNLSLQRPFYFGRKLTANFGWGLRGLWISQNLNATASGVTSYTSGGSGSGTGLADATSTFHQKSWALGPRFEFGTNWLLGCGFRFMADLAASILYTRYTSLEGTVTGGATSGVTASLTTNSSSGYNTLRAVTESSLGLGWGSYFGDNNDFHFDLSASYEFNVYWNQNMMGMVVNGNGSPANNYLHGLNIAARFDF